jgi:hypothetical protein
MIFFLRNKIFLSILTIVISIIGGFFYVRGILTEANNNFTSLSGYSSSLINSNDLKLDNIGNFELSLGGYKIRGGSLADFVNKINELYQKNILAKIEIRIIDKETSKVLKVYEYTYSDFSYSIDTDKIVEKIKYSIINAESGLTLSMKDYVYFDNKKFNEVIMKIKEDYKETSIGQTYLDSETKTVKVNNNKLFLTYIDETKLNIEKVDQVTELKGSSIELYLKKKENSLFKEVDSLNAKIKKLSDLSLSMPADTKDFNRTKIQSFF